MAAQMEPVGMIAVPRYGPWVILDCGHVFGIARRPGDAIRCHLCRPEGQWAMVTACS